MAHPVGRKKSVALRKESVDRNVTVNTVIFCIMGSLSARRAWIEILYYGDDLTFSESLSARRAWIEMNINGPISKGQVCRSPQGERG